MAVWSEVNLSSLQYTRLDGEFYSPQYIKDDKLWACFSDKYSIKKLGKLLSSPVRTGHTPRDRRITKDDELVHFIKTNTLREGRIDYSNCFFLPKRVLKKNDFIPNDSVVVTIIGATPEIVGRTAIIRDIDPERVTNQNVAIIETSNLLDPYYLTAYFQTKYGRDQLWRHSRRTEQVNLNCREVERVIIPYIDIEKQKKIGNLIRDSFSRLDLSQSLYTQAQELLERELGLDKLVFDRPLSYEARLSEVVGNNRADADYYQIPFRMLEEHLKKLNTTPLGKMATVIKGTEVGSHSYVENGIPFLRVSNIKDKGISLGNSDKYISSQLYSALKCYQPQVGELLLTKDGTPGVCYTVTVEIEGIVSGGVVRLQLQDSKIPKEYLSLVINSRICKMQIDQECSGALIVHWKPNSIMKLKIPVLPDSTMKELGGLVSESKKALYESQQLLEQAKRRVEELIEQAVQK